MRPTKLSDVIGNKSVLDCVQINVDYAKKNKVTLKHTLLSGPAGCGKTTISLAIANELDKKQHELNASTVTSPKPLIKLLTKIDDGDIIFVDEIHRLNKKTQESLYTAMEDNKLLFTAGDFTQHIQVKPFTLIGATTNVGLLEKPFISRFQFNYQLNFYTVEELSEIIIKAANKRSMTLSKDAALQIASYSKLTPRIALNHLEWLINYCGVKNVSPSIDNVQKAFDMQGIDESGLGKDDRKYLEIVEENQPIGIQSLSTMIGLKPEYIENHIEPYLIHKKLITKTSQGRVTW